MNGNAAYRKGKNNKSGNSSENKKKENNLVLKDTMTAALVTNFQISEDQAAEIYASALANSQGNE